MAELPASGCWPICIELVPSLATRLAECLVTEPREDEPPLRRRHYVWWAVFAAVVASYAFGISGFWQYYQPDVPMPGPEAPPGWLDLIYVTTRLFIFEWDLEPGADIPCMLAVARWLAPASLAAATIKAIVAAFWDQFQVFMSWVRGNHAVVCGLGRKGVALVTDMEKRGIKVVAVERDPDNSGIQEIRLRGIPVLKGTAADRGYLRWASVSRAAYVFTVTGDDKVNLEIASQAAKIRRNWFPRRAKSRRCAIHIADPNKADLFADASILSSAGTARCRSAHR